MLILMNHLFPLPSFLLLSLHTTLIFYRSLTMCVALFLHHLLQVLVLQVLVFQAHQHLLLLVMGILVVVWLHSRRPLVLHYALE
jgi:hypothetical protein